MTAIVLPPDLEADLTQQATREGKTLETVVIDGLRQIIATQPKLPPKNLLEFLGDFVGCLEGNGEANSENTGERFTEYLVQKKQAGKL